MDRVKIAVVDSGVDLSSERLRNNIIDPKSYTYIGDKELIKEGIDFSDRNGHGTAVAYTILRNNIEDLIIPVKVTNNQGRTSSKCLINALEYLVDVDVNIINISLSTTMFNYEEDFKKVCDELVSKNKYIVASMDNSFRDSLPSLLPSVIGVRGKNFHNTNSYWYNDKYSIQCICDDEPIFAPGIDDNKYKFFTLNSKATAVMTSNISKLLKKHKISNYNELQHELTKSSIKNNWGIEELNIRVEDIKLYKEKCKDFDKKYMNLYEIIRSNFNPDLDINYLLDNHIMSVKTGINKFNISKFLSLIENELNVNFDCDSMSLRNINSIYELFKLL